MVSAVNNVSSLLGGFPAQGSRSNPLLGLSGFGPDFIVEMGSRLYGQVAGYGMLSQLNRSTTGTLQLQASQATTSTPIYSEKQADEINGIIGAVAGALHRGDFDGAEQQAGELLKKDFNSPIGYHLLGRIAASRGDYTQAAVHYQRASDLDPENTRFAQDVFNARQLQRSDDDVLATGQKMVRNKETALDGVRLMFELSKRADSSNQGKVYLAIAEGFKNLDVPEQQLNALEAVLEHGTQSDMAEVSRQAEGFIEEHKPVGLAYSILGRAQQLLGQYGEALQSIERAKEIITENIPDAGLLSDALARLDGQIANVHATIGNEALQKRQLSSAEYHFDIAHQLDLLDQDIKLGLAAVKTELALEQITRGRDAEARSLLSRARSLLGSDDSLDAVLAKTYMQLGDRAVRSGLKNLAVLNYEDAYAKNPQLSGLKRKMGDLYYSIGQKVVDSKPYSEMTDNEFKDVISNFQKAFDLFGSNTTFRSSLGTALNEFGLELMNVNQDYDQAVEIFRRAWDLYPDNATYSSNYMQAKALADA